MLDDFFDIDSEPIITLEPFYGPKKHLVDKCLVLFSIKIYEYLIDKFCCNKIAVITACNGNTSVMSFVHNGEQIAFYLSSLGSSLAGDEIIEVNHLTGATKFVMFGSCGSLNHELTNGRFIIPTEAYRGEGLSYYFVKSQDYIKIKNAECLAQIFDELKIPYVKGKVWTTECMLRETVNLVNKRRKEGCIAVEMELAGVQAVCDFYHFELFDFLASGDVVSKLKYDIKNLSEANNNIDKLQIALKIIERV